MHELVPDFNGIFAIADDAVAKLAMHSLNYQTEFSSHPPLIRYCISLGRSLLNPLLEFTYLGDDRRLLFYDKDQHLLPTVLL